MKQNHFLENHFARWQISTKDIIERDARLTTRIRNIRVHTRKEKTHRFSFLEESSVGINRGLYELRIFE